MADSQQPATASSPQAAPQEQEEVADQAAAGEAHPASPGEGRSDSGAPYSTPGPVAPGTGVAALRARLDQLAQQENQRAAAHRQHAQDFAQRGERLLVEIPPRFFVIASA